MKTIITFGSKHLEWLHHKLNPMQVALIIEADSHIDARNLVFKSRIGEYFATSYPYDENIGHFKKNLNMKEYSLAELDAIPMLADIIESLEHTQEQLEHTQEQSELLIEISKILSEGEIIECDECGIELDSIFDDECSCGHETDFPIKFDYFRDKSQEIFDVCKKNKC